MECFGIVLFQANMQSNSLIHLIVSVTIHNSTAIHTKSGKFQNQFQCPGLHYVSFDALVQPKMITACLKHTSYNTHTYIIKK